MCSFRGRILGSCVLATSLLAGSGCLSFLHPDMKPGAELVNVCHACPQQCRNRVYIFLMNGCDVTNCCNLTGLADCLRSVGYPKTYYGCPLHQWWFTSEIRRLHEDDPEARFVLIGDGLGGNLVDAIAWNLRKEWVPIDLIVYLDCNTVAAERPDNAARVVNIWSDGNLFSAQESADSETVHLSGTWPLAAPSHPVTLETLADELAQVASRVPVEVPEEPAPVVPPEAAPTPRPVMPPVSKAHDDWDFLKPVRRFDDWPVLTGRRKGEPASRPQKERPAVEKITANQSPPGRP